MKGIVWLLALGLIVVGILWATGIFEEPMSPSETVETFLNEWGKIRETLFKEIALKRKEVTEMSKEERDQLEATVQKMGERTKRVKKLFPSERKLNNFLFIFLVMKVESFQVVGEEIWDDRAEVKARMKETIPMIAKYTKEPVKERVSSFELKRLGRRWCIVDLDGLLSKHGL